MDPFDVDRFIPRGSCGQWLPAFKALYLYAQWFIFASYVLIGASVMVASRFRSIALTPREEYAGKLLFGGFIFSCGIGHGLDGPLAFVWPNYHVFAIWHTVTAAITGAAFLWTFKVMSRVVSGI